MSNLTEIKLDPIKIKKARGERTQQSVARALNLTPQAISKIENGRGEPSGSMLLRMCILYNCSITELANKKILSAS